MGAAGMLESDVSSALVSKITEGPNSFGQVAVELHHAGRKEGIHHRPREKTTQVCLEETQHLGFVGFSERKWKTNQISLCQSVRPKLIQQENSSRFSTFV